METKRRTEIELPSSWIDRLILFGMERRVIVLLATLFVICWGILVAPFDWSLGGLPRDPVPVDAIPDIGENQQIVYTEWPGRSARDVEDQITYPLSSALMGLPGVKTIRGSSFFGFSNIYIIFNDDVDFYWSRSRVLEKLNSLPSSALPSGIKPSLGPDATALGQVMWYVLDGLDAKGSRTGGWDLQELRTVQDWYVRYALLAAEGVSEVASVGGFVREYQVDVDPNRMRAYGVKIEEVVAAARRSNIDVGASSIEINKVEYIIRGVGFIKKLDDLRNALIKLNDTEPVFIRNVANVTFGPAARSGALDLGGEEAVGGVVVVRHGANPLEAIKNVKKKIEEISPGLPRKTLSDGSVSQVRVVPFYDRSSLIYETLGTLNDSILEEILVAIIVIILVVMHLESSLLISAVLPLAVLISFIAMKLFHVDANIVALAGIAIAIGTLDDMGIIICESILKRMEEAGAQESRFNAVYRGAREVGSAVLTAGATTVVSFLPVFALEGMEGKLFRPLAFTKTFALAGSVVVALMIIPSLAYVLFVRDGAGRAGWKKDGEGAANTEPEAGDGQRAEGSGGSSGSKRIRSPGFRWALYEAMIYLGGLIAFLFNGWLGLLVAFIGGLKLLLMILPERWCLRLRPIGSCVLASIVTFLLAGHWMPFGPEKGLLLNTVFVGLMIAGLLSGFILLQRHYGAMLTWCLEHKGAALSVPGVLLLWGALAWIGFAPFYGLIPGFLKSTAPVDYLARSFPGLGKEFMPPLDEGGFLYMPVTMPHASIGEALDIVQKQDMRIRSIPEVEQVVGKLGRAESALDPAPVSMIETVINYLPKYISDRDGRPLTFRYDSTGIDLARKADGELVMAPDGRPYLVQGRFERDSQNRLIPDESGKPYRLWRPALDPSLNPGRKPWKGIRSPNDVWAEIVKAANIPGATQAPQLQPISARIVMLQSGIRASFGVKVKGPDLASIEETCSKIEKYLREVPSVAPSSVIGDRIIGKPYLEIEIDRQAIAQYEIDLQQIQDVIGTAIGGDRIMTTVEGRERYPVRVRYLRELRDSIESMGGIFVPSASGTQIPLAQLTDIRYVRGPEIIKTEDTFLTGYVLFDKRPGNAEVDVVEHASRYLRFKMDSGELQLPAGVSYSFTGNYENQVRSEKKLRIIIPVALFIIFVILYLQFNSVGTTLLVFSCIPVAWAGGFVLIWLYGQPWFLDFSFFGVSMRELFQVHPVNLSVAVWVGFLALFGIAADDGVVMATYLEERFAAARPQTVAQIRKATVEAGLRRIRPCLMTTATTILALLPVLTSSGRGSELMLPMAIPAFGGMTFQIITMWVIPIIYCAIKEKDVRCE